MNFDKMTKEDLIEYIKNLNEEQSGKFGIVWDKEKVPEQIVTECDKFIPILSEEKDKAIINDGNTNLLIEGDNFHSLSVLNYTHKESIDIIYIDPPYNTGNKDFIYNDKFVDPDDGYRHSKWLNFMEKRLKIARNLLKDDGIIMVSINETEQAQLKLLLDRIFGSQNFLSNHHIQSRYSAKDVANNGAQWLPIIEYVYIYAKNVNSYVPNLPQELYDLSPYHYIIEEKEKGKMIEVGGKKVEVFNNKQYKIIDTKESKVDNLKEVWASGSLLKQKNTAAWYYNEYLLSRLAEDGTDALYKIYNLGEDGLGYRYVKAPQKIDKTRGKVYQGVPLDKKELFKNGNGAIKYKPIINFKDYSPDFGNIIHEGGVPFNSGKKPIKMLKELINYHKNRNAIVLDFFAGSGSTGHAVLDLNREDGGNRKFILCTNNENNICEEITYRRLKNVINGYEKHDPLGSNLKYFKTEFVNNNGTRDQLYYDLTERCIPMLCVKSDTYNLIEKNKEYAIYSNKDKTEYSCVYFDIFGEAYDRFIAKAKSIKEHKNLYIFSLSEYVNEDNFKGISNYTIEPIPYKILDLYKNVVKMSKEN